MAGAGGGGLVRGSEEAVLLSHLATKSFQRRRRSHLRRVYIS